MREAPQANRGQVAQAQGEKTMTEPTKRTFTEEIEVAGTELVTFLKDLVDKGNARRVVIRNKQDRVLLEIPLTAGAVIGGAVAIGAPVLAAVGAMAALISEVKLEIERDEQVTAELVEPEKAEEAEAEADKKAGRDL